MLFKVKVRTYVRTLYNFIVSNYVEPLKLSNQMSTVKFQVVKS
jgi:hypothetical protein